MNRRQFLLSSAISASASSAQNNLPVQRPNILIVMANDLGAWMLGCYGNKEIKTPNIDYFSRGGLKFTNAFCATPIASPSRATFFTGRLPRQHGIHDYLTDSPVAQPPQGQKEVPSTFASEVMLSDLLAKAGYNCGYVGKWHMGNDRQPGHGHKFAYTIPGGTLTYTDPEMSLNGQPVKEQGYLGDLITRRACEFIDQQTGAAPFLLTTAYLNPHTPYTGHPQKYYDMYANSSFDSIGWEKPAPNASREKDMLEAPVENIRKCAAAVSALDDQIPVLMRKLQDKKLWDNTLIVFTSDNGYLLGRHGLWSKGHASDPPNMYEEVMKVPLILSWPGKLPPGEIAPELVSLYDLLPTFCEATGVAPPSGRNLPGRSFLPVAKRDPLPKNQPWKNLVFGHFRNTWMARDARYKLIQRNDGKGPNELFDTSADPREKANRFDDPQYTSVKQRLTRELDAWKARTA